MRDPRAACRFEALAVALKAKTGSIEAHDLARLAMHQKALGKAEALYAAIDRFHAVCERQRRDADALYRAGCELHRAVERDSWPRGAARVDLHG